MAWKNVKQTPKYYNGGVIQQQANTSVWGGLSNAGDAIADVVAHHYRSQKPPVTAEYGMYIPQARQGAPVQQASSNPWNFANIDSPSMSDYVRQYGKGLDRKSDDDKRGFWDMMITDNIIGGLYGAGKSVYDKGKARKQAKQERIQSAIAEGGEHTQEMLRREQLGNEFRNLKEQERIAKQGETDSNYNALEDLVNNRKRERFHKLKAEERDQAFRSGMDSMKKTAQERVDNPFVPAAGSLDEIQFNPVQMDVNENIQDVLDSRPKKRTGSDKLEDWIYDKVDSWKDKRWQKKNLKEGSGNTRTDLLSMLSDNPDFAGKRAGLEEKQRLNRLKEGFGGHISDVWREWGWLDEDKLKSNIQGAPTQLRRKSSDFSTSNIKPVGGVSEEDIQFRVEHGDTIRNIKAKEAEAQALQKKSDKARDNVMQMNIDAPNKLRSATNNIEPNMTTLPVRPVPGQNVIPSPYGERDITKPSWLHPEGGMVREYETGGYLSPRRPPSYAHGGNVAQVGANNQAMNTKLLEGQQNTQGYITNDSIRQGRMRKFIAELNNQSPMFIDTILRR
tara:strand:- start:13 stop:1692 length:1680 start_codon:yes stop_codon:yes gene_type:complete